MNGEVIYNHSEPESYSFGTTAEYRCESGFGLSGGDSIRSCEGDASSPTGFWSGDAPGCEGLYSHSFNLSDSYQVMFSFCVGAVQCIILE